jgi:hypothetical protein
MNERIKELFNVAKEYTESQDTGNISQVKLNNICAEKFAELIVKECLSNMENCDGDLDFAIWKIKKEFGVKE